MSEKPSPNLFQHVSELFTRQRRKRLLERQDLFHLVFCLFIVGLFLFLFSIGRFERFENLFLDYFFRQRPPLATHPAIAVIEIDEPSLQAMGRWPWPWRYYAQMMDLLTQWEAKAIVLDSVFSESNIPYEDNALQVALEKSGRVYLPVGLETKTEKKIWVHSLPISIEPKGEERVWAHSAASLEKAAKGIGHIHIASDADGVLRRIRLFLSNQDETYPYLGLVVSSKEEAGPLSAPGQTGLPEDERGDLLINWAGAWKQTFEHFSYGDLVRSSYAMEQGQLPLIAPEKLKGKICLVGLTAPGLGRLAATPQETPSPILAAHANVLNSLLQNRFIFPASRAVNGICLAVVGMIATLFFATFRNAFSFIAGLSIGILWILVAFFLFWLKGVWLFVFHPLLLILALFIFSTLYVQIIAARERMRLLDLATRDGLTGLYVIRHFREILNRVTQEAHERGQYLSLVLIDVDNFKPINDTYGHVAGDMVLKRIARIIFSCLRSKRPPEEVDFVGRYGGEEFIVLLRNAKLEDAASKVAERIRKSVEEARPRWGDKTIPVTISLGVATLHPSEAIPDAMVRRADDALYRAKGRGKNRVSTELIAFN